MFDVVGKRRWYFAFSALLVIPGLFFILLTPITAGQAGLQFTIDYTGGTRWEIRFQDPNVTADQVRDVLTAEGLPGSTVARTEAGYFEIKTIPIGLAPAPSPTPEPTASPTGSPDASPTGSPAASPTGSPAVSPSPEPSPTGSPEASPDGSPTGSPSSTASPSPSPSPTASPAASPTPSPTPPPPAGNTQIPTTGKLGEVATALQDELGPIAEQRSLTTIGPVVSSDLITQALVLIAVGSLGILLWITFRFRDVKFGATALVALVHDVIVVVGLFAILGTLAGVEIDALFVTAMLTVIGFSVHDTIVVFDRVRENKARHVGEPFADIVNHSILQTFGRSITTSFTVVITLLALFLFGGSATQYFVLALLIGVTIGTYSSIFNAAPLLVVWQEREDRKRGRTVPSRSPRRATP